MYGSVFRLKPKAGKEQAIVDMMREWEQSRRPNVKGARGGLLYKLDNGGLMSVVVFDSKEDYMKNAEDPQQDAWYRKFRELLEADPEWNDGEVVRSWGSPA